jgi:N utilization substance protein B
MPSRHRSRQRALQILFQLDLAPQPVEQALLAYYESLCAGEGDAPCEPDAFMEELVRGTLARRDEIDPRIRAHSAHWRLERMPVVDRNILRLAIWEMTHTQTPAVVVIDEALELGQRFSGPEAVPFLNGVLDAVRREASDAKDPHDPSPKPQQDVH